MFVIHFYTVQNYSEVNMLIHIKKNKQLTTLDMEQNLYCFNNLLVIPILFPTKY